MFRHVLSGKVAAVCVVALAAIVPTASADPLTISSGFFTLGGTFGVDLGFNVPNLTTGDPATFAGEGNGRAPGLAEFFTSPQTLPALRAIFSPTEVKDPTTNSSCPGCGYGGDLTFFTGPLSTPAAGDAVSALFTMSGTFDAFAPGSGARLFHLDVSGSGTASISRDRAFFNFAMPSAATPEPMSALLLMSGIAIVARRIRRGSSER
jgi:hypothetical protein